jgi:hypothetical protein
MWDASIVYPIPEKEYDIIGQGYVSFKGMGGKDHP